MKLYGRPRQLPKDHPWPRIGRTRLIIPLDLHKFLLWSLHHISPTNATVGPRIRMEDLADVNADITGGKVSFDD